MFRILIIGLLIFVSSTAYADRYGRSDATNSPAYHGRHYNYSPIPVERSIVVRRSILPPVIVPQRRCYVPRQAPSYTPRSYYGVPYGAYRSYTGPNIQFYYYQIR